MIILLHRNVRVYTVYISCQQTAQQFTERLNEKLNTTDTSLVTGYPEAPLAYDAVWSLAFAFNKTAIR